MPMKAENIAHRSLVARGRHMKLRRIVATITVAALFFWAPSAIPFKAFASVGPCFPLPACPVAGGTSSAGAAATGGFIGFVALLAAYDFVRRTTCIGDPLRLGGPGFSEKMPPVGSILPPQCKVNGKRR
jgi:hypothetical protein